MIGFLITATRNGESPRTYSGYREGKPGPVELIARALVKYYLKQLLLTPTQRVVETIASMAGAYIGAPIGEYLAERLTTAIARRAEDGLAALDLHGHYGVRVCLSGDFEFEYVLETPRDIDQLRPLLEVIPARFATETAPRFMGEYVVEACYVLQLAYLRDISREFFAHPGSSGPFTLNINIHI